MEWFAFIIPIVTVAILRWRFPHRVVWWELLLPLAPPLVIILAVKFTAESTQTRDYERWGGWCTEVRYYEDWNEYIHRTCTRQVPAGTDSKGRTIYRTETYDCSYVDYHPEYWQLHESNGAVMRISRAEYNRLVTKFGGRKTFKDLRRHYHTNDGDMYYTRWTGTKETFQPIFTEHSYENRVQVATGIYEFPRVDPKKYKLYKFPRLRNTYNDPAILGNHPHKHKADKLLQYYNAKLGRKHQIRFWILLFKGKPRRAGLDQESYWKGGNKNEVVICIGLDADNKPTWCYPFCWAPDGYAGNDVMKINIRDHIENGKNFDLVESVEYSVAQAKEHWQRKPFAEFSYLTVAMPTWAIILIYVLTALATGGASWFAIANSATEQNTTTPDLRFWRRWTKK